MHTIAELMNGLKNGVVVLKDRLKDGSHTYVYVTLNSNIIRHSFRQNAPQELNQVEIEEGIRQLEAGLSNPSYLYEDKTTEWSLYNIQTQSAFKVSPHYFRGVAAFVAYTIVPQYSNYPDNIGYADESAMAQLVSGFQAFEMKWADLERNGVKIALYQVTEASITSDASEETNSGEVEITCLSIAETLAAETRLVVTIVNLAGVVEAISINETMIEAIKAGNELEYKLKDESWIIISMEMDEDFIPSEARVIHEKKGFMVMDSKVGCKFVADSIADEIKVFNMPCYALKVHGEKGGHRTEFYLASN